ncbi:DNA topoisomerase IB [Glaciihabitans arcticus]|uniref:DNA topoisomerase n=1 Tax=Glaciihabitans arcticus TaxID=2668039 RepID=A0A4Q9GQY3_9MICO|nr:DNA topoisomerase IB [Glaciihabitans arcticus]TBN57292.1 DNA topoisomerase IB [Glaciihabitans arcticus]
MPRLRRSNLTKPGFTRQKKGTGFSYSGPGLLETDRSRIEDLAIPPAWSDVWIAPHPNSHIQATGVDVAGRRQYIYHSQWRETKDKAKFDRALDLAAALPGARRRVTVDLRSNGATEERALGAAFRMLDTGALRIGSERYAETNGSHGLSTLLCAHARVSGGDTVELSFPAKSGHAWSSEIKDEDLAAFIMTLKRRGPNARLLAWKSDGEWHPLAAEEINDYVREVTGGQFTAKDFRTLRGTIAAAESLAGHGPERTRTGRQRALAQAMRDAADALGNTPAIAKKSYVDPRIVKLYRRGITLDSGSGSADAALRRLLVG